MEKFWETFDLMVLTWRNVVIVGSSWSFIFMLGKMIPNSWRKSYKAHVVPGLLMAICLAGVWVPGLRTGFDHLASGEVEGIDGTEVGWRLGLGVTLSVIAYLLPVALAAAADRWLPEGAAKKVKRIL